MSVGGGRAEVVGTRSNRRVCDFSDSIGHANDSFTALKRTCWGHRRNDAIDHSTHRDEFTQGVSTL
jgi:hypothetical protein